MRPPSQGPLSLLLNTLSSWERLPHVLLGLRVAPFLGETKAATDTWRRSNHREELMAYLLPSPTPSGFPSLLSLDLTLGEQTSYLVSAAQKQNSLQRKNRVTEPHTWKRTSVTELSQEAGPLHTQPAPSVQQPYWEGPRPLHRGGNR